MELLARAPLPLLEQALHAHSHTTPRWLRPPETGLMMIQGRAGGTGDRFNVGEVTVTRCALRLSSATERDPVGVAYVLGRSHRHAFLAALADALLADPALREDLEHNLLAPIRSSLTTGRLAREQRAHSSKVEFFTVAREGSQSGDEDDQA